MEALLGNVLRYGILLCAAILAVGLLVLFAGHSATLGPQLAQLFTGQTVSVADPTGILNVGVVLLIALPIVRVALTLVVFAVQRDWHYVVITGIVLTVLLYGLFG